MLGNDTVVDPLHDRHKVWVVNIENVIHRLVEACPLMIGHITSLILRTLVIERAPGA